jgi:asparagine synthase (glutamine-hydrolysing)
VGRIVGIFGGAGPAERRALVERMRSAITAGTAAGGPPGSPGAGGRPPAAGPPGAGRGPGGDGATVEAAGAALGARGTGSSAVARGPVVAVVDGHVYNADELGADVDPGGGAGAAAVLVALTLRHGFAEALRRLNGDFAAALYDARTDTGWLGRDRFGVRPLYYRQGPGHLAVASRPRALLALPGVSTAPNRRFVALFAAAHYRAFDNRPEESPYAAIAQLPAGHLLRASAGAVSVERYWALEDAPDLEAPEAVLAEQYRALLLDAVARRLRAAPGPAFTLSGGMDSSSVLAAAVRAAGVRPHAFSAVYEDRTFDESEDVAPVVEALVEAWHPVKVGTPDVLGLVRRMVDAHDEPVATATWLSHFLLCEEVARQGFGSLFGGLGGDELNAGEYEYFLYHFADLRAAGLEAVLAREVEAWIRYHDHPVYRKSAAGMEAGLARLVDLSRPGRCRADRARLVRWAAALDPAVFDLGGFEPVMDHPFRSYLRNRAYQDLVRETMPCCLRAEDRQTAAFGLDHFLPFLDHRLVELMFRVPGRLKIRDGVTKHLLREAMRGLLPEATRTRVRKTGWNAPAHVWFAGPGGVLLRDLVRSRAFRERGIYRPAEVERILAEHERIVATGAAEENHMMFLWQLVNLETWLEQLAGR